MIDNYGIINDRSPHLVADLCEIISYFENREVSRGDVETFLAEKGGDGLLTELNLTNLDSAEANEKFQALSEDVFQHLAYRQAAFADWYPFEIDGDILVLREATTDKHKTYAALLGYSRLKMFKRTDISVFAKEFEKLCVEAAANFAENWVVVHFGAGGRDRPTFGNKLKEALTKLADVLGEIPVTQEIDAISEQDSGDAGIDVIIYGKWPDPARGIPTYFGQCAAQQENWPAKKFEANGLNLRKYFNFFHDPGTLLFIPVCYRNADGKWINSEGHTTVIIDRLRLVSLLDAKITKSGAGVDDALHAISKPFEVGCALA